MATLTYRGQAYTQHKEALKREAVQILELGVYAGQSTRVFLHAIRDKNCSK